MMGRTADFTKTVPSVHTLLMNTIYLYHITQVAKRSVIMETHGIKIRVLGIGEFTTRVREMSSQLFVTLSIYPSAQKQLRRNLPTAFCVLPSTTSLKD